MSRTSVTHGRCLWPALPAAIALILAASRCAAAQPVPMHLSTPVPATTASAAHARYSRAPINLGPAAVSLTLGLVQAGGGATTFDATRLIAALSGGATATPDEMTKLNARFGQQHVDSFVKTFDFVAGDALEQLRQGGYALSAAQPSLADPTSLIAELYGAGVTPRGSFDAEYMLDGLLSHPIHVRVMNDIDANPGLGYHADADFHHVLGALLLDLNAGKKP